jgi:hypothetical protein
MKNYTYRIVNDTDGIAAWIDINDVPTIYQPYHPESELVDGKNPWASEDAAETWVKEHIEKLKEIDVLAAEREAQIQRVMKAITEQGAEAVFAKIEATE